MATLSLARRGVCFDAELASAASLPDWLESRWALVFSHPDDFAALDFEADRWRRIVADALAAGNVRALRVLLDGPRFPSWIEQMSEEDPLLVLAPRPGLDARIGTLRDAIARADSRFVMIVDESLALRRTFKYSPNDRLPSVLDLIATATALRAKQRELELQAAADPSQIVQLPNRSRAAGVYG